MLCPQIEGAYKKQVNYQAQPAFAEQPQTRAGIWKRKFLIFLGALPRVFNPDTLKTSMAPNGAR